jgi:hypothetical protein
MVHTSIFQFPTEMGRRSVGILNRVVFDDVIYKREFAEDSGYDELAVYDA